MEQERAIFTQNFRDMNWDMVLSSNPALTLDADYTVGRLYYSENKEMNYANRDLDKLLLAAKAESDQEKRKELYAKATKMIWDDAVGHLLGRPEDRLRRRGPTSPACSSRRSRRLISPPSSSSNSAK